MCSMEGRRMTQMETLQMEGRICLVGRRWMGHRAKRKQIVQPTGRNRLTEN